MMKYPKYNNFWEILRYILFNLKEQKTKFADHLPRLEPGEPGKVRIVIGGPLQQIRNSRNRSTSRERGGVRSQRQQYPSEVNRWERISNL